MSTRALLALVLAAAAGPSCAGFRPPEGFEPAPLRERAVTHVEDGVSVSAALLLRDEVRSIFGVDLLGKAIQPVWLEIENGTEAELWFLPTGVDPEYFAPLEVAYGFHVPFAGEGNRALDAHLSALHFEHRAPIPPGRTVSGFVYTNAEDTAKTVDVDLVGTDRTVSLALLLPDPNDARAVRRVRELEAGFPEAERVELEDADELWSAVEELPCCARDAEGLHVAPLDLVVVGRLDEWGPAFQRRGFQNRDLPPLLAFRRAQDLAGTRRARWVDAEPLAVRLWETRLRFRGEPVWVGAVSAPRGGRFARDPDSLEPRVDQARNAVVEQLFYSQGVAEVGFAGGAGCEAWAAGDPARTTDGLRILLVFEDRSIGLDEIGFFDWERIGAAR